MIGPLQLALDLFDEWRGHAPRDEAPPAPQPAPPRTPLPDPTTCGAVPTTDRTAFVMELRRSPRRRSLSIEVHPDLRVVVRAPARLPQREIDAFVSARARWIAAQLEHFGRQPHAPLRPGYRDGDTHYYLGQAHRLSLQPQAGAGVTVEADSLVIGGHGAADAASVERSLGAWYRVQAEREFRAVLAACHAHPRFAPLSSRTFFSCNAAHSQ